MTRIFLPSLALALLGTACAPMGTSGDAASSSSSISSSFPSVSSSVARASSVASSSKHSSASSLAAQASSASSGRAWNAGLSADQIAVLKGGTETPYTSPLLDEHRAGTFVSADCDIPVFRSEQKFDSGTGWPSFWAPIKAGAVIERKDTSYGMTRTEILSPCGGHLGHVFNDGPEPTGLRYCMNGLALKFIPDKE